MAKRIKTIRAGRLVGCIIYTAVNPRDPDHVRRAKLKHSTKARRLMNMKRSTNYLKYKLAANFSGRDLHVTLTYDDDHLPANKDAAIKNVKRFIRRLRCQRLKLDQVLKYIYVTESKHGDGRIHHHMVLNGTGSDLETLLTLWGCGSVDIEYIDLYGYQALAEYLTKEPREVGTKNGARAWSSSQNLTEPEITNEWADDHITLAAPPGAVVLDRSEDQNEYGSYAYIEYLLPEPKPFSPRRSRKRRN